MPLIIDKLSQLKSNDRSIVSNNRKLPQEIESLSIITYERIKQSYFSNSQGGAVSNLTNKHVMSVLKSKNHSIDKYETCDYYWLIIKMGNYFAGSFDQYKINQIFKTKFDKIFIYNIQTDDLTELEIQKYA